jgi:hypothetical protein
MIERLPTSDKHLPGGVAGTFKFVLGWLHERLIIDGDPDFWFNT